MLYTFLYPLWTEASFLNVLRYPSFRIVMAALTGWLAQELRVERIRSRGQPPEAFDGRVGGLAEVRKHQELKKYSS